MRSRYRLWKRRAVDHEFFLDTPQGTNSPFELKNVIPDDKLSRFCEQSNFLSPMRLLRELKNSDHVANITTTIARMNILLCNTSANSKRALQQCAVKSTPLVYDTGASHGLTPFRSDFIDYQECDIPVKDISKVNRVRGIGTGMYKFVATNGDLLYLPGLAYHLDTADIRLFSPQTYHQLYGGSSTIDGDKVVMKLQQQPGLALRHDVEITIDKTNTNLPMIYDVACSDTEKKEIGHHFRSAYTLGFTEKWNVEIEDFDYEFGTMAQMLCPCVGSDANENLSRGQKELLLNHWKLGINMQRVQDLMRGHQSQDSNGKNVWMPPVIKPKFPAATTCPLPKCQSCELARAKKRNPKVVKQEAVKEKEAVLAWDKYEVGDFVSMDQFVVKTPGRQLDGYGREGENNRYHGGTIFNDAASGIIWVENQISLGAGDTIMAKEVFEEWLREKAWVEIKHYHSDNGVFTAEVFREDCKEKHQKQSFSGVGAQHQNAKAERAIQTIMWMARTFMLHVSLHWTERGVDDIALWGFAVKHAAWLYNRLPNRVSGLTPIELLTKEKSDHRDLLRSHVWGCPVYVLDPTLQSGKKIPKWNRRARMGQFLGFSEEHSSLVAKVRHLSTGFVSPQYHVVFDDKFETVFSSGVDDGVVDAICDRLFESNKDIYVEPEFNFDGELVYSPPPLDEIWLTEPERRERIDKLRDQRIRNEDIQRVRAQTTPATPSSPPTAPPFDSNAISDDERSTASASRDTRDTEPEGDGWIDHPIMQQDPEILAGNEGPNIVPEGDDSIAPEGDNADSDDGAIAPPRRRRRRQRGNLAEPQWGRDDNGRLRRANLANLLATERVSLSAAEKKQFACTLGTKSVPPLASRMSRKRMKYKQRMARRKEIGDMALNTMEMNVPTVEALMNSPLAKFIHLAANDCGYRGSKTDIICRWVHPLFLKAKSAASKEDNPTWKEATNGPFAEEYWEACKTEIATLEGMEAWEVVKRTIEMNVIPSTWAFKCKRFPDGLIKKFKARFCARGDMQIEGVDFFETYAPVVQWTTIRLMLILEVLLGLKSKQGDVTAAFLHADFEEGEEVFVEMPRGFRQDGKVLKLRKTLYGCRQSPRAFWKYLVAKMDVCGMKQSQFDPCLFVGDHVIAICYVDDILFWSKDDKHIHDLAMKLREAGVDLEQEDDAAGFLGVRIEKNKNGLLEMTQEGLIDRIIETLGLDVGTVHGKWTPAEVAPLVRDDSGEKAHGDFSYSSVVGMLLYLSGHSRPDIAYAVNCAARYMFCPKHSHEKALKRLGRYLKATRTRGLVLNPTSNTLKIDSYPDADFAGMYGHEENTDPACVKSRSGYVITVADCPVLWKSSLQQMTAQSTMEAEIIALAQSCKDLFPIMDIVESMASVVGLPNPKTSMHVSIHEDNAGALILAETLPPQFTPRSKHYALKTIWFREEIVKRGIKLFKISTVEQLGDIFTKSLTKVTFEYLRKKLQGW